ncbi:MAG TPA: hypothetical protein VD864_13280 [Nocardioides sp.]|nr:hypothetical protein [Nocardioides sp.]
MTQPQTAPVDPDEFGYYAADPLPAEPISERTGAWLARADLVDAGPISRPWGMVITLAVAVLAPAAGAVAAAIVIAGKLS